MPTCHTVGSGSHPCGCSPCGMQGRPRGKSPAHAKCKMRQPELQQQQESVEWHSTQTTDNRNNNASAVQSEGQQTAPCNGQAAPGPAETLAAPQGAPLNRQYAAIMWGERCPKILLCSRRYCKQSDWGTAQTQPACTRRKQGAVRLTQSNAGARDRH